jgi:hypothetical protein
VAAGVLLALAVVFVFESTEETEIRFVSAKVQRPLWVALAVTMGHRKCWSDSCWPAAVMLMPSRDGVRGLDA